MLGMMQDWPLRVTSISSLKSRSVSAERTGAASQNRISSRYGQNRRRIGISIVNDCFVIGRNGNFCTPCRAEMWQFTFRAR